MRKYLAGGFALLLLSACMGDQAGSAPAPAQASDIAAIRARSDCPLPSPHTGALEPIWAGVFEFQVEIADTEPEHSHGLMCRESLEPNQGMLFLFDRPQRLSFWMRNTLIPLDLLFIAPDGTILNIAAQARPLDETPLPSAGVASAVLELAGGRAEQLGLKPGDKLKHRFFTP